MNGKRIVIKIGGSTLGQHDTTMEDLVWLQQRGYEPIVVHGGGKTITEWLDRQGVESRFVNGLRITDEAGIDVVVAVLAGLVNKRLVAGINARGGRAVGISGADGPVLRAAIKDPDLGLVGEPVGIDPDVIEALIAVGYIPVVSPIAALVDESKVTCTLLNVNADTAAADIGGGVQADQFIFLTDVPGVCDDGGRVLSRLTETGVKELIGAGTISGGMIPKVEACLRALKAVPSALILDGRERHALRACIEGQDADALHESAQPDPARPAGTRIG